ncbi:MAG: hypothetical protein ACOC4B_01670 [Bacteroidota bacterium]
MKHISKKEFKELSDIHIYGKGLKRKTALFFDWSESDAGSGFKYMYMCIGYTKKDILDEAYDWIVNEFNPPYWAQYKYASTDSERFKVPLAL